MPQTKPVTIQDIANELSLSKMTVSAVLTGSAERVRISAATQERVRESARRLGYRPNEVARSLRRRSTNTIGFYTGHGNIDAGDPWLYEIVGGLQAGCRHHRKDLLLHSTFSGTSAESVYDSLVDGRIDGLIYYGPIQDPLADRLRDTHLPVVAIVDAVPTLPSVVGDYEAGVRAIAAHLAERGHRRVLYLSQEMDAVSVHERQRGFFAAAAARGLSVEDGGMVRFGAEDDLLARWRAQPADVRPTVAVAWDDQTAYRVWGACRRAGISVPGELALVGFDGVSTPMEAILRLTTVRVPWPDVARRGVDHLVGLRAGETIPPTTVLPVTLVVGDTT